MGAGNELLPALKEALAYEGVSIVTCPVDCSENIRLTDRLGELTDPNKHSCQWGVPRTGSSYASSIIPAAFTEA